MWTLKLGLDGSDTLLELEQFQGASQSDLCFASPVAYHLLIPCDKPGETKAEVEVLMWGLEAV